MATTQPFHRPSYGSLEDHRPEGSAPFTMHSADGNTVTVITLSELTDLRAMQRTFELAYLRTSLGEFCFACLVLKLFSSKFQFIGLIYTVLCLGISVAAYWRYRLALNNQNQWTDLKVVSDTSDVLVAPTPSTGTEVSATTSNDNTTPSDPSSSEPRDDHSSQPSRSSSRSSRSRSVSPRSIPTDQLLQRAEDANETSPLLPQAAPPPLRITNHTFRTAGDVVVFITVGTTVLSAIVGWFILTL